MRLRRRIQLLLVPLAVLVAVDVVLDRHFARERDRSLAVVEGQLEPARLALADLLQALVDQETGERGYIITGQDRFLAPYREGQARADTRLAELETLLPDDSPLRAGVDRIRSRVTAWRQLGAEYEIEAKREGRDEEAAALVSTGTGMRLFDSARNEVADLQGRLTAELADFDARIDVLRDRLSLLRMAAAVLAAGFVVGSGWLLVRWITRPLHQLELAVQAVAAGDLDRPIPAPGPPDLADLGRDVEAMRRRILAEVGDATRARDALAKRGMIVLTLREELAPGTPDLPPGIRIATRYVPAEGVVAGDWFDVVRVGPQKVAVALVDVSGHGPDSAVFALKTKQLALAALRSQIGPAATLEWLATQLGDTGETFLTAVVVEVDGDSGAVRYASAGHPAMVVGGQGGPTLLGPTGPLLGPLPGSWQEWPAQLEAGGFVAAYSDGVVEMADGEGGQVGVDGLVRRIHDAGATDPERVADACMPEAVLRRSRARDDLTVVVVGWSPAAGAGRQVAPNA